MKKQLALITAKKAQLDTFQPFAIDLVNNLNDWFKIELTYTSNALEGNTLSRAETAQVVEKGLTVQGKTLREHLEAVNHAQAFDWIKQLADQPQTAVTEQTILDLHQLILQKTDDVHAGRYRTVPVRIAGSRVIMPNFVKVPSLMSDLSQWMQQAGDHPVTQAIDAHFKLVSIHPFVDGNGRTARLLMNLLLMKAGYPPLIIRREDRHLYLASLEKAQLGGSLADYYKLMYAAAERSLDIYLAALTNRPQVMQLADRELLKIGELAQLTGETVPTIRHWTKEGLLHVNEYSVGGYQLYYPDQVEVVQQIRQLQKEKRLTLVEIKQVL